MKTIKINRKDLGDLARHTNTPTLAKCRKLISEGVDPDTRLEVYRDRDEPDIIVLNIGLAAKLSVKEEPRVHFCKYSPPRWMGRPSGLI